MEILDMIDRTLGDYVVSADAMRWTPEPVAHEGASPSAALAVDMSGVVAVLEEMARALASLWTPDGAKATPPTLGSPTKRSPPRHRS